MRITGTQLYERVSSLAESGYNVSLSGAYGGYKLENRKGDTCLSSGYVKASEMDAILQGVHIGLRLAREAQPHAKVNGKDRCEVCRYYVEQCTGQETAE